MNAYTISKLARDAGNMNDPTTAKFDMERDLSRALARDEFMLRYQPQLDIQSNRLVGVEALLRWIHPEHGAVDSAQFIPAGDDLPMPVPL